MDEASAGGPRPWHIGGSTWHPGDSGPLPTSILFVDLVSSTDLASVMGLEEFARFAQAFRATCHEQCRYFFERRARRGGYVHDGRHYHVESAGDELVVFLHTGRPHDDVYQLVCLALTLKCVWLGAPPNAARIQSGRPTIELAAGIHSGPVWATRSERGFEHTGFAIHLAKRIESVSRRGERFRIFVSDPAFKLVNRRMRNLIFGPRLVPELKGVSSAVGVYELIESFLDPLRRLAPDFRKPFAETARIALGTNTFDLWIHSCIQVSEGIRAEIPEEQAMELCQQVLNIDPRNAVALFTAAEGARQAGDLETARLYLEDLTGFWPGLADGWLALARVLGQAGDSAGARRALLQARRYGIPDEEAALEPGANARSVT